MIEPKGGQEGRWSRSGREAYKLRQQEDEARYRLQAGMAKVALDAKRKGVQVDVHGTPLYWANRMAQGYSEKKLEEMVRKGRR